MLVNNPDHVDYGNCETMNGSSGGSTPPAQTVDPNAKPVVTTRTVITASSTALGPVDLNNPLANGKIASATNQQALDYEATAVLDCVFGHYAMDCKVQAAKLAKLRAWLLLHEAYAAASAEKPVNLDGWRSAANAAADVMDLCGVSDTIGETPASAAVRAIPDQIKAALIAEGQLNACSLQYKLTESNTFDKDKFFVVNVPLITKDAATRALLTSISPAQLDVPYVFPLMWTKPQIAGEPEEIQHNYGLNTTTPFLAATNVLPDNTLNLGWLCANFWTGQALTGEQLRLLGVRLRGWASQANLSAFEPYAGYIEEQAAKSPFPLDATSGAYPHLHRNETWDAFPVDWNAKNVVPFTFFNLSLWRQMVMDYGQDHWTIGQLGDDMRSKLQSCLDNAQQYLAERKSIADKARESIANTLAYLVGYGQGDEACTFIRGAWAVDAATGLVAFKPKPLTYVDLDKVLSCAQLKQGMAPLWANTQDALDGLTVFKLWASTGQKDEKMLKGASRKWLDILAFAPTMKVNDDLFLAKGHNPPSTSNDPIAVLIQSADLTALFDRVQSQGVIADRGALAASAAIKANLAWNTKKDPLLSHIPPPWQEWAAHRGIAEGAANALSTMAALADDRTSLMLQMKSDLDALCMEAYGVPCPNTPADVAATDLPAWFKAQLEAAKAGATPSSMYGKLKAFEAQVAEAETAASFGDPAAIALLTKLKADITAQKSKLDARIGAMTGTRGVVAQRRGAGGSSSPDENSAKGGIYSSVAIIKQVLQDLKDASNFTITVDVPDPKNPNGPPKKVVVPVGISAGGLKKAQDAADRAKVLIYKPSQQLHLKNPYSAQH